MALYNFKDIANCEFTYDDLRPFSGEIDAYDWKRFDQMMLIRSMLRLGYREPKAPIEGKLANVETTKQLYKICTSNPMDSELKPGLKIQDIYCCRENADMYQERPTGYRMMELRYIDCTPESRTIDFRYPYTEDAKSEEGFIVRFFVSNPNVYNNLLHRLYNIEVPVVVYGDWTKLSDMLTCSIEAERQVIVPEI